VLLALGVDYIPRRAFTRDFIGEWASELEEELEGRFVNSLRWRYKFRESDRPMPAFYIKTKRNAPTQANVEEYIKFVRRQIDSIRNSLPLSNPRDRDSIHLNELYKMMLDQGLIIKEADKNLGVTVLKLSDYNREVAKQLSDTRYYQRVSEKPDRSAIQRVTDRIWDRLIEQRQPDCKVIADFIFEHPGYKDAKLPIFYINPKIHKTPWAGRPIVASLQWVTTPFSIVVGHYLQLLVKRYAVNFSVITHSTQLIDRLVALQSTLTKEQKAKLIMQAGDISSMYTNLQNDVCLAALRWIKHIDHSSNDPVVPLYLYSILEEMLSFVLNFNYFEDPTTGQVFRQHSGIAMGSNCSPDIANLTCYYLEYSQLNNAEVQQPLLLVRYLDDLFVVRLSDMELRLNYGSSMSIVWSEPSTCVEYLDLKISFTPAEGFTFKVHQKALNAYQYPHFKSNISMSVKKGFIKGELIRYIRIYSNRIDYEWMKEVFKARLIHRGYPSGLVDFIYRQVPWALKDTFSSDTSNTNTGDGSPPLIFRMRYDDRLQLHRRLGSKLKLGWSRLIDDRDFAANNKPPMICHTIQRKLRSSLIRSDHRKLEVHMKRRLNRS
jgi:hypothetical protein